MTSSWNAYVGLNLNPDSNVSQNDYIRLIVGLAYKKMITDAGGRDSDGWRRQHDDLVKWYDALRKKRGEDICLSLQDQKNAMRGIARQWMADMNTAKGCGIHLGAVMVASEEGAEKENRCKRANWELGLRNALHYSVSKGVIQRKERGPVKCNLQFK